MKIRGLLKLLSALAELFQAIEIIKADNNFNKPLIFI
jgi:hypothetical protein